MLCTDPYVTVDSDLQLTGRRAAEVRPPHHRDTAPSTTPNLRRRHAGRRRLEHAGQRQSQGVKPRVSRRRHPPTTRARTIVACLDRICRGDHVAVRDPGGVRLAGRHDRPVRARSTPKRDARGPTVLNTYGRGPAQAIRYGIAHAVADVVVVTMADGCDDPMQIDQLARLVERGVVVACASRYMRGGQQVGGPWLKGRFSRLAGVSLHVVARVGTHDATNSFKAYSRQFVQQVGIESDAGFELGIELVAKARRLAAARSPRSRRSGSTARTGTSNFQARAVDPALSALVSVRVRARHAQRTHVTEGRPGGRTS